MEAQHTTTLTIKVNAQQLGDLEKQLQLVFDDDLLKGFKAQLDSIDATLKAISQSGASSVQAIERGFSHSADALRSVASQIGNVFAALERSAERQAEHFADLRAEVERLTAALKEAKGAADAAGGDGGGGGFGGGGGWGGGGTRSGRALRAAQGVEARASRGLAMPTAGIGGIAMGLSGIPIVGAAAAGGLLAAASSYGSYMGWEHARLGALPYLNDLSPAELLDASRAGARRSLAAALGTTSDAERRMAAAAATYRQVTAQGPLDQMALDILRRDPKAYRATLGQLGTLQATGMRPGPLNPQNVTAADRATQTVRAEYARLRAAQAQAAAARKVLANPVAGAGGVLDQAFSTSAYEAQGLRFGLTPQEALHFAGGLSQAAGERVGDQDTGLAMALERLLGISGGQTGGLFRSFRYMGQGDRLSDRMAELVGSAFARGLKSSEVGEDIAEQAEVLRRFAERGIQLDVQTLLRMEQGAAQTFGGPAGGILGARAIRSATEAISEMGFSGGNPAIEYMLMRAGGFSGAGAEGFAAGRLDLQRNPLGRDGRRLIRFVDMLRQGGAGPAQTAFMLQQSLAQLRVQLGPDHAEALARSGLSLADFGSVGPEALAGIAEQATSAIGPHTKRGAGIEMAKVKTGAGIAGAVQDMEAAANQMAQTFVNTLGPALRDVTGWMNEFTGALEIATRKLWESDSLKEGG